MRHCSVSGGGKLAEEAMYIYERRPEVKMMMVVGFAEVVSPSARSSSPQFDRRRKRF